MDEKHQCSPEGDRLSLFCHGMAENPIDEEPASQVEQNIQNMIAGDCFLVERAIDEEGQVQERSDHMIEVTNKRVPLIEMGVTQYR